VLRQLAVELETSVDYLLCLTDNPAPKDREMNARIILGAKNLHWDGIPLTEKELKPIRDILEIIVRNRLARKIEEGDSTDCGQSAEMNQGGIS
jgi:hypothetical protein